ncbi:MAG: hypothetical protein ABFC92_07915 [Rectinema sp.]|jgi:hypothetical protein
MEAKKADFIESAAGQTVEVIYKVEPKRDILKQTIQVSPEEK